MFTDPNSQIVTLSKKNYMLWFILAFNAGCINMGGYLACNRFVTHVTGYATYVGGELSLGNIQKAFLLFTVPVFFIIGGMIAAWYIERAKMQGHRPKYKIVFFYFFCILSFVSIVGPLGLFGEFGSATDFYPNYILLALLAMGCGMQNSMISTATGLLVRTTHLTGISTDLSVGLIRLMGKHDSKAEYNKEFRTNLLRIGTIMSFILGSLVASGFFRAYKYHGFWLPTSIIGALTIWKFKKNRRGIIK